MSGGTAETLMQELLSLCVVGTINETLDFFHTSYSRNGVNFRLRERAHSRRFDEIIHLLWKVDRSIGETVSFDYFSEQIVELVALLLSNRPERATASISVTLKKLKSMPLRSYRVLREMGGAILEPDTEIRFGEFVVFDSAKRQDSLLLASNMKQFHKTEGLIAEISVKSRDKETALTIADRHFRILESALSILMWRDEHRHITIVRNSPAWLQRHYIEDDQQTRYISSAWLGNLVKVNLKDPLFESTFSKALFRIASSARTELDHRLLRMIDWLGQAVYDPSDTTAFVKAAVSLEVLFTGIDQSPISASITAKIAESTALLVARETSERIRIESLVRTLYGRRSAIMHSGSAGVAPQELRQLLDVCRSLLIRFSLDARLQRLHTREDLHLLLQTWKYAPSDDNFLTGELRSDLL